jgi:hypothetical protein
MQSFTFSLAIILLFACTYNFDSNNSQKNKGVKIIHNPISAEKEDSLSLPIMSFIKKVHDFKEIYQGEKLEYKFKFKNTGQNNLIISSTKTTCGCTVSDYPKEPILPGASAYIKIVFDSENKSGYFHKAIEVSANTIPNKHVLEIIGKILIT